MLIRPGELSMVFDFVQVLVRCMDDLASLLSVLTENRWIIGADLDHIPIQARELVPNLKVCISRLPIIPSRSTRSLTHSCSIMRKI